ncbi:hypothetical protein SUDANB132_00107 [Streptomyces sp. enrichment culture]
MPVPRRTSRRLRTWVYSSGRRARSRATCEGSAGPQAAAVLSSRAKGTVRHPPSALHAALRAGRGRTVRRQTSRVPLPAPSRRQRRFPLHVTLRVPLRAIEAATELACPTSCALPPPTRPAVTRHDQGRGCPLGAVQRKGQVWSDAVRWRRESHWGQVSSPTRCRRGQLRCRGCPPATPPPAPTPGSTKCCPCSWPAPRAAPSRARPTPHWPPTCGCSPPSSPSRRPHRGRRHLREPGRRRGPPLRQPGRARRRDPTAPHRPHRRGPAPAEGGAPSPDRWLPAYCRRAVTYEPAA